MVSQLRGDEPRLELGDSGESVQELQYRLYRLGYYRQFPDGTYDMATENAVRELQSSLGQDNDGMVTTETWEAIVHWEQQSSLDYQFPSPSDAIDQLRYDLDHPQQNEVSPDGQWQWNGTEWVAAGSAAAAGGATGGAPAGQLSEDGQWQWNGSEWVAAAATAETGQHSGNHSDTGQLSEDGQWRWTGSAWVAATAQDGDGQLSADGYWRWNGTEWVAA